MKGSYYTVKIILRGETENGTKFNFAHRFI